MKKIIRLTESDLHRIVESVLSESEFDYEKWSKLDPKGKKDMEDKFKQVEADWNKRDEDAYWKKKFDMRDMWNTHRNRNLDIDPQEEPETESNAWDRYRTSDARWPYDDGQFTDDGYRRIAHKITESVMHKLRY